jgi:hypothetical protein
MTRCRGPARSRLSVSASPRSALGGSGRIAANASAASFHQGRTRDARREWSCPGIGAHSIAGATWPDSEDHAQARAYPWESRVRRSRCSSPAARRCLCSPPSQPPISLRAGDSNSALTGVCSTRTAAKRAALVYGCLARAVARRPPPTSFGWRVLESDGSRAPGGVLISDGLAGLRAGRAVIISRSSSPKTPAMCIALRICHGRDPSPRRR